MNHFNNTTSFRSGKPLFFVLVTETKVLKRYENKLHPYLTSETRQCSGVTVEHMLQWGLLACEQTSVCPQQTLRTFQHVLSKTLYTCLPLPPL